MRAVTSIRSFCVVLALLVVSTIALAWRSPATTAAAPVELACHGVVSPILYCQASSCGCTPVSTIWAGSDAGCEQGCFVSGNLQCGQAVAPAPVFMPCGTRDHVGFSCGVPFGCDHGNIYVVLLCSSCQES